MRRMMAGLKLDFRFNIEYLFIILFKQPKTIYDNVRYIKVQRIFTNKNEFTFIITYRWTIIK